MIISSYFTYVSRNIIFIIKINILNPFIIQLGQTSVSHYLVWVLVKAIKIILLDQANCMHNKSYNSKVTIHLYNMAILENKIYMTKIHSNALGE